MQRSRRAKAASLERSSMAGRKRLYKVSVSLVVASWVVIFLLNSLMSYGNGYKDAQDTAVGESSLHEGALNPDQGSEEHFTVSDMALSQLDHPEVEISEGLEIAVDTSSAEVTRPIEAEVGNDDAEVLVKEDEVDPSALQNENVPEVEIDQGVKEGSEEAPRNGRLPRVTPLGLDEFKNKAIAAKEKAHSSQTGTPVHRVEHRVEPSGKKYNYASSSKGAKVLAFNKEAKGASNILDKDQDKYLRNPCSAEGKFVIIELSEETLVDAFEITNFEHYSSNLKDFELWSSLVYPTENWEKLGNFTAANVKHAQRFSLPEPKWARYLKLNLLSHYGSEFYCILSMFEVYGVDAVEKMLEDLIPFENKKVEPQEQIVEQTPLKETTDVKESSQEPIGEDDFELEDEKLRRDSSRGVPDQTADSRTLQVGRIPGDTVLKVLMQKVQNLDVSFSVLERYLEELNNRYGQIFKEFDDELDIKDVLLEKIKLELKQLEITKENLVNEIEGLLSWKLTVSSQLHKLVEDNAILRSGVEMVHHQQVHLDNKCLAVIFLSFVFGSLAITNLSVGKLLSFRRLHKSETSCRTSPGWLMLLLSSCLIAIILVL